MTAEDALFPASVVSFEMLFTVTPLVPLTLAAMKLYGADVSEVLGVSSEPEPIVTPSQYWVLKERLMVCTEPRTVLAIPRETATLDCVSDQSKLPLVRASYSLNVNE